MTTPHRAALTPADLMDTTQVADLDVLASLIDRAGTAVPAAQPGDRPGDRKPTG